MYRLMQRSSLLSLIITYDPVDVWRCIYLQRLCHLHLFSYLLLILLCSGCSRTQHTGEVRTRNQVPDRKQQAFKRKLQKSQMQH